MSFLCAMFTDTPCQPTCAKDNEVRDIQVQLVAELEHLTVRRPQTSKSTGYLILMQCFDHTKQQSVSATKSARRELVFRIKQEKDMLSLTKSSVKVRVCFVLYSY